MNLKELMMSRRTTRKYTDETMDDEKLLELLMYASTGPSKGNAHPVEFVVLRNKEKLKELAGLTRYSTGYLADANQAVIVLGDMEIDPTWVEEASIAAAYLLLLLEDEGQSASWINVRTLKDKDGNDAENTVRKILDLPEKYGVLAILPFGVKNEHTKKRKPFEIDGKVHFEN